MVRASEGELFSHYTFYSHFRCSIAGNGKGKSNALVKVFIIPVMKQQGLSLECPLKGQIKMLNITAEQKLTIVFPHGLYRITFHAFNNYDDNIANISMALKIEP